MAFSAGAIVASLNLNTSSFNESAGGAAGMASALGALMAGPVAAGIAIATAAIAATGAALTALLSNAASVAGNFDDMGDAAARAGVSVEFLSSIAPLAKESGVGTQELSSMLGILAKNASEAAAGGKTQMDAFSRLGISAEQVKGNLNNMEGLFGLVQKGMAGVGEEANKTNVLMDLFGRSGNNLKGMFEGGGAGMAEFQKMSNQTGATVTATEAKMGESFERLQTVTGLVWSGLTQKLATPILAFLDQHLETIIPKVIAFGQYLGTFIPAAFEALKAALLAVLPLIDAALAGIELIAKGTDASGMTSGAASAVGTVRQNLDKAESLVQNFNITAQFDEATATTQVAEKMRPILRESHNSLAEKMASAVGRANVARSVGGR